jgi:ligand-binding SRPBCC domain-containing protein
MPIIHLTTFIQAEPQVVFDCSRSITLHKLSMQHTNEQAVAGVTSGLINLGETVTWQAKHFFKTRTLQVKITAMDPPVYFKDEMVKGDFEKMIHEHHFKKIENGTIMIDIMDFSTPYGVAGRAFNKLFLSSYLHRLLLQRNQFIKKYAETNKWKTLL